MKLLSMILNAGWSILTGIISSLCANRIDEKGEHTKNLRTEVHRTGWEYITEKIAKPNGEKRIKRWIGRIKDVKRLPAAENQK